MARQHAAFLTAVNALPGRVLGGTGFPFNLPSVRGLDLQFRKPVTFLIGETGRGKTVLLDALAELSRLPVSGGGRNELASHASDTPSALAPALNPIFQVRPHNGFYLRTDLRTQLSSVLDYREGDLDKGVEPQLRYAGRTLAARTYEEAFLELIGNLICSGIFLLDEPEKAFSPQQQLALLALMWDLVSRAPTQFIIATHSPILLTYPDADIYSLDHSPVQRVDLRDAPPYQITRGILLNPEHYWQHLRGEPAAAGEL